MLCSSLAQRPGTQQEMKAVICQSGRPGVGLGVVIERTDAADPRAEQMLFLGTLFEIHTPPRTPDQCDSFLTKTPIKMSRCIFARLLCFTAFFSPCLFSPCSSSSLLSTAANWKRRVHRRRSNEAIEELCGILALACWFLVFLQKQT